MNKFLFGALALTFGLVGCSAGVDANDDGMDGDDVATTDEAALRTTVQAGTFKLYDQPRATPNPFCDLHTDLELKNTGSYAYAALKSDLDGNCRIAVPADSRQYRLKLQGTSCGSKIYTGSRAVRGGGRATITVTDHRTRICRDLPPAKIVVEETAPGAGSETLYSLDAVTPPPPPASASTWFTYSGKQCMGDVWDGLVSPSAGVMGGQSAELQAMLKHFENKGIAIEKAGFAWSVDGQIACAACGCPRFTPFVVKAKTAADARKIAAMVGFKALAAGEALTTAPVQCGGNAWEAGQQTGDQAQEARNLATWAESNGAPLAKSGFVNDVEPRFVCMACQCPRGDYAIAIPETPAAKAALQGLGWAPLEN